MGGLANAGRALQGPDFPAGLVGTMQGLVLFFALGGEILARYRIRRKASSGSLASRPGEVSQ
jgi:general nucleoside transport system permease protein